MIPQQTVDIVFAALCTWREARGEVEASKLGVLCVLRNRFRARWIDDDTYQDVCEHPWQFSGMTAKGDPNLSKWPASREGSWLDCLRLAELVVLDRVEDSTGGAVFYHDISIPAAPHAWGPVAETLRVGRLVFYRGISG